MNKNITELLPGWKFHYNEVSNGVYEVSLTDSKGRQAATKDHDISRAISTCKQYAFDIEKQLSVNFNSFLFDTSKLILADKIITAERYDYEVFGSWTIEITDKRLLLDGRDYLLVIQVLNVNDNNWEDESSIELTDLSMEKLEDVIGGL